LICWQQSRYVFPTLPHPITRIRPASRTTRTHFATQGKRISFSLWANAHPIPSLQAVFRHLLVFHVRHSCFLCPFCPQRKHVISLRHIASSTVEGLGLIIYNIFDQLGIGLRTQSISDFVSRVGKCISLGARAPSGGSAIFSLFKDTSHKIIVQLVK
jgi:hypothetical protein